MEFPLKTQALVVHRPGGDFEMTPIVIEQLGKEELLVEMKYSGICHTDLLLQKGALAELPAIAGHEGAGIVRAVGRASLFGPGNDPHPTAPRVGDAVLLSFTSCGDCFPCGEKGPSRCLNFPRLNLSGIRRADGTTSAMLPDGRRVRSQFFGQSSFARMSVVHSRCVVKCPDAASMPIYAPMGCAYQTGAGTIFNVLKPKHYHLVAVFGAGSVGCAAIMAAAALPVRDIIAIDIVEAKLEMAKELGASITIDSSKLQGTLRGEVMAQTGGRGLDFAIDTTGSASVVEQMLECLAYGGTAASVGAPSMQDKIIVDLKAFFAGMKTWVSVAEGDSDPQKFIPRLIRLHKLGKFPVDKLSKVYPVVDIKQAIADMHDGKVIKPIIEF